MPTRYLRRFFAEKDIPEQVFTVNGRSGPNSIPNAVVVEHFALCSPKEIAGIENTLRRIDFVNGDVNHFLNHLAKALAR